MTTTFTIDTRDVFTAHKAGCAHLDFDKNPWPFVLTPDSPTRDGLRRELDAEGFEDCTLAFAPCLRDLP